MKARQSSVQAEYDQNVFINCPFDDKYAPLFKAIVFAVHALGFRARCARERLNSGESRLQKIGELITASRYSIHDLSRVEADGTSGLPRFNMPLELGIDLGCRMFSAKHKNKFILILDTEEYRYQKYISDIAGQDIQHHSDDPHWAILKVRDWLLTASGAHLPGGEQTHDCYLRFCKDLPKICRRFRLDLNHLHFVDFSRTIAEWLKQHK